MRYTLNSVTVNGDPTVFATGACEITMTCFGLSNSMVLARGFCTITMTGSGTAEFGASGNGVSSMTMSATGTPAVTVQTVGSSTIKISARHSIPRPKLVPPEFNQAHPEYRMVSDGRPAPVND